MQYSTMIYIFCRKQLREQIAPIFIGPKISAHEPFFTPIFKKSVHVRWA